MASISTLVDRVKIVVLSSGTGAFSLGQAVPAFRGTEALVNGATYSYATESGSDYEVGTGVYLSASNTLVRSPQVSSNSGAAVAFPANIEVAFTILAQDISPAGTLPIVQATGTGTDVAMSQNATTEAINTVSDALTTSLDALTASIGTKANASAIGVAASAENMGEYASALITDDQSAKQNVIDLAAATEARAVSATLAATGGAALIGAEDGASGTLWTTVQGFINKLLSSAGSAVIGFIQAGTGAVTRTLQAKLRDTINAKDFGVTADGSTNDTAALQAAITAAAGKTIILPAGTINVNAALTVPSNTSVIGAGKDRTTIKQVNSSATDVFLVMDKVNCYFAHMTVDGNKPDNTVQTSTGNGFSIYRTTGAGASGQHTLEHLKIINCRGCGVLFAGANDGVYTTYLIENCTVSNCYVGYNNWVGVGQFKSNNQLVIGNTFQGNRYENLTIDVNSNQCVVTGNHFFAAYGGCGNVGWDVGNSCVFTGNFMDCELANVASLADRNGICLNADAGVSTHVVITDNIIRNAGNIGIYLRNRVGAGSNAAPFYYPGAKAGTGIIANNIVVSSVTADIKVEATDGPLLIKNNILTTPDTVPVIDAGSRENVRYLTPSEISFQANKNGTDQTGIAAGTSTLLTFGTTEFNRGAKWATGTSRFTPPPGRFILGAVAYVLTGSVDQEVAILDIRKNGTLTKRISTRQMSGTAGGFQLNGEAIVDANGTDYFEFWITIYGGTAKTVAGGTDATYAYGWAVG